MSIKVAGQEMDLFEVQTDQDYVTVQTITERDPGWSYTDLAGHTHRYVIGHGLLGKHVGFPSTLKTVVDYTYWCEDCRDEHEATHVECVDCGEHIVPGVRPGRQRNIATTKRMTFAVPKIDTNDTVEVEYQGVRYRAEPVHEPIAPDTRQRTVLHVSEGPL